MDFPTYIISMYYKYQCPLSTSSAGEYGGMEMRIAKVKAGGGMPFTQNCAISEHVDVRTKPERVSSLAKRRL